MSNALVCGTMHVILLMHAECILKIDSESITLLLYVKIRMNFHLDAFHLISVKKSFMHFHVISYFLFFIFLVHCLCSLVPLVTMDQVHNNDMYDCKI